MKNGLRTDGAGGSAKGFFANSGLDSAFTTGRSAARTAATPSTHPSCAPATRPAGKRPRNPAPARTGADPTPCPGITTTHAAGQVPAAGVNRSPANPTPAPAAP